MAAYKLEALGEKITIVESEEEELIEYYTNDGQLIWSDFICSAEELRAVLFLHGVKEIKEAETGVNV